MEMRCALSGERITRIPIDDPKFMAKFKQPYAVTHRHDLHSVFHQYLQKQQPHLARDRPHRHGFRAGRRQRYPDVAIGRARARPRLPPGR